MIKKFIEGSFEDWEMRGGGDTGMGDIRNAAARGAGRRLGPGAGGGAGWGERGVCAAGFRPGKGIIFENS